MSPVWFYEVVTPTPSFPLISVLSLQNGCARNTPWIPFGKQKKKKRKYFQGIVWVPQSVFLFQMPVWKAQAQVQIGSAADCFRVTLSLITAHLWVWNQPFTRLTGSFSNKVFFQRAFPIGSVCLWASRSIDRKNAHAEYSLTANKIPLPAGSDSEGGGAALDLEAQAPHWQRKGEKDGQLADYIQVGCCPLGEQSGLPGVIHLPDTSPSQELVFSNILSVRHKQDGSVFTPSFLWQAASHPYSDFSTYLLSWNG